MLPLTIPYVDLNRAMFSLGKIQMTPLVYDSVPAEEMGAALQRHMRGDWGEVEADEEYQNDRALFAGERIISRFTSITGVVFWIITEGDRSATTILLPEEH